MSINLHSGGEEVSYDMLRQLPVPQATATPDRGRPPLIKFSAFGRSEERQPFYRLIRTFVRISRYEDEMNCRRLFSLFLIG